jgi:hypothetical protein
MNFIYAEYDYCSSWHSFIFHQGQASIPFLLSLPSIEYNQVFSVIYIAQIASNQTKIKNIILLEILPVRENSTYNMWPNYCGQLSTVSMPQQRQKNL